MDEQRYDEVIAGPVTAAAKRGLSQETADASTAGPHAAVPDAGVTLCGRPVQRLTGRPYDNAVLIALGCQVCARAIRAAR